ncbi:MAG TPA: MATE family efflux transporter, partial [Planctomycetota bacterium]|nr:MATE family efflux transporter [Planctomycetota bacterium]
PTMASPAGEPILKAIARLAPFAILSFILQNAYNQLDAWFLGRISSAASNALGLFMFVQIANFGVILVFARGTQSLVGRRIGAGQREGAALALAQGLGLALRVVVPLTALQWLFAPQILGFMGGQGEAVEQATLFLRTLFLFMPVLFLSPIVDFSFQALGDTRTPFRLQMLALGVNAALNWALVFSHRVELGGAAFEFGGWGVAGSAVATGVSRLLAGGLGFLIFVRRYRFATLLASESYRSDRRVVGEILRVGLPAGSSTLLYSLVGLFVMQVVGRFGQDAYGAYGIGFRGVESFSFMIVLGLGTATATVAAHAAGAGDFARVRRAGHVGASVGASCMLVTGMIFLLFPSELAGIYTSDPGLAAQAATYIRAMALCQVPQSLEMIYGDAMAGAGSTARTVLIQIPGNALRIPLAWLLAVSLGWGLTGVWAAIVVSAALKGAGMTVLYWSRSWERAMHHGRKLLAEAG